MPKLVLVEVITKRHLFSTSKRQINLQFQDLLKEIFSHETRILLQSKHDFVDSSWVGGMDQRDASLRRVLEVSY